jgi:RNA polymerase sigma factor (sigma-70 family)
MDYIIRFNNHQKLAKVIASKYIRQSVPSLSQDIHQWALIGLWRAASRFSGVESEFRFYASKYIEGTILDGLRKETHYNRRKKTSPVFVEYLDNVDCPSPSAQSMLEEKEQLQSIFSHLRRLPPRQSEAISHLLGGLRESECASLMGVTQACVSRLKLRAIEKLTTIHMNTF